jgi:exodeoxyribonuclease VII large subunit
MTAETATPEGAAFEREVLSVSRLNRAVRELLEGHFGAIWVEGEISNMARPASGHVYFSLKDDAARNTVLGFEPADGMHVVAYARVGMYETRGDYQLIVEHMEPAGEGMLRLKFEQLKRRLAAEGLFDAGVKRALPEWPGGIGVVTSASGAAIRDILQVLKRRSPVTPVVIYPCGVQGSGAAPEIVNALEVANKRRECDVLIVARGGGSIEDLWAFNEEAVARAIHRSDIPVVSGIGHEIDFTIADLVADVRAPTPSASAELVSNDCNEVLKALGFLERRLKMTATADLTLRKDQLGNIRRRLVHPGRRIEEYDQRLDDLCQRLPQAINTVFVVRNAHVAGLATRVQAQTPMRQIQLARARLEQVKKRAVIGVQTRIAALTALLNETRRALRAVSPIATLERGYAIVSDEQGRIARDAAGFRRGDRVSAQLAKGSLNCSVESILAEEDPQTTLF